MTILQSGAIASTGGGYQIERSLRFNSADSANLSRTPSSTGNRRTFTFSAWVKLSSNSTDPFLMGAGSGGQIWIVSDKLRVRLNGSPDYYYDTAAVLRDFSAWYHIVVAVDTTDATAADRVKIYINGTRQTIGASATPTQNFDTEFNLASTNHRLGQWPSGGQLFNGYMAEVRFIDGQALTPSSFGETDSATGVWKPKAYSGTYGTNGFYLKFADNSGTTSTTLGKDSSGNGNNWTPNNFSVTAGAGNDSMVDSPTAYGTDTGVGGTVRGNYCTVNPLDGNANVTLSNGNLDIATGSSYGGCRGTIAVSSGKWYWEVTPTSLTGGASIGIWDTSEAIGTNNVGATAKSYAYWNNGQKQNNNINSAYGASYTTNDVIGVALDLDAGTLVFYKNNSSQGTAFSSLSGNFAPGFGDTAAASSSNLVTNFGQRAFAYTAPSGFKALCTQNLPTPTIGATSTTQADDYFNAVLYSGNSSTQAITGVGFQPDFVWCKARSTAAHHIVTDAVRTAAKVLSTSQTAAESAWADNAFFQSLNSDGFTLTGGGTGINTTGNTYVAWNWKANGAGSSNTAGTITSTVSASTTSGFSIATFTQLSGSPYVGTVGHGLGVAPSMVIIKDRSIANGWLVYHASLGATQYLVLSSTAAAATGSNAFNNTAPTSTVFTTAAGSTYWGNAGATAVAYCFAPVAGYSAFGSYTGNNLDDGPFIFTNFRPAFVLIKATNTTQWWTLLDSKRDTYNVSTLGISPNSSDAESTFNTNRGPHNIDFTSNGFKIRTSSSGINGTNTFIYAAFAENPFKYSLAR